MSQSTIDRRAFLKTSAAATFPLALELGAGTRGEAAESAPRNLEIVCVGAHPDDPESGCGGALVHYAALGHSVTIVYLTRGERGIRNTALNDAAKIRSAEAEEACKIMGARPVFFGQIDGDTRITREEIDKMTGLLANEKADVVFTHWPIDTHMDHQVASILTIRACMAAKTAPQTYFFEVDAGSQTRGFMPNTYVDISESLEKKKSALFAHKSQDGRGIWLEHHEIMAAWRGREMGVKAAEAFVRLNYGGRLGPLGL
jgi:LmbE family N-acetylglucosaminyl deacetylase